MNHPQLIKTTQQIEDEFKNGGIQPWTNNKSNIMKTTVQAFLDNVIIKPDPTPSKTEGGVHIPESARIVPLTGTVVNVGTGYYASQTGQFIPMTLKKGQRVLHKKFQTTEINFNGERHLIMKESNIEAIL